MVCIYTVIQKNQHFVVIKKEKTPTIFIRFFPQVNTAFMGHYDVYFAIRNKL